MRSLKKGAAVAPRSWGLAPDAAGSLQVAVCAAADITERKRAEENLRGQKSILEMVARGAPLSDTLDALMHLIESQAPGVRCGLLLVSDDGRHLRRGSGPNLPEAYHTALDGIAIDAACKGSCIEAAYRRTAVAVADIAGDTRYTERWRALMLSCGFGAIRSTPVCGSDGRALASFAMHYDHPCDPSPADPQLIETATHLAAIALERKRAEETLERHNRRLKLLTKISSDLLLKGDAQAHLQNAFDAAASELGAEIYFSYLIDDDGGERLRLAASGGIDEATRVAFAEIPVGQYLCGRVARERRPLILCDVLEDTSEASSAVRSMGVQCYAGFPMLANDELLGTIAFCSATRHAFSPLDAEFVATLASQFAAAIARERVTKSLATEREAVAGLNRQLAKDSERLRQLFQQAPGFMCVLRGPDHVFELVNSAYQTLIGHRDVIGKPLRMALPEVEGQGFFELLDGVYRTGEPFTGHAVPIRVRRIADRPSNERFVDFIYQPIVDTAGQVTGIFVEGFDVTDRVQGEAALRDREREFHALADNMSQFAWMTDSSGWICWYNQRWFEYTGTTIEQMQGWGWRDVHHPDHVERVVARIKHSFDTGEPWEDTFPLRRHDGIYRWFLSRALPIRDNDGAIVRWFGTNTDITERRRAEEQRTLLINELNHRVKNTLATVQSLAVQTMRNTERTADARELFNSRLGALSRAHDILTDQSWEGAALRDVVDRALAPFRTKAERLIAEGPDLHLSPKQALSLSMALHELATNATKYGALTSEAGRVAIDWSVGADGLELIWAEEGGPPVVAPKRSGFGSRLIERGLAQELGGTARLDYRPAGLVCTITTPIRIGAEA